MTEAGRMDIHISIPGDDGRPKRIRRLLTLDNIILYIQQQELDEYTTNGLIALAEKYPTNALPSFRKNINIMINRVRTRRRKEQQKEDLYPLENKSLETQELPKSHPDNE
jgi:hypothetical protein